MADDTQELVADEARRRPVLAVASAASGVAFLAGGLIALSISADQPRVRLIDALGERLTASGEPTLKVQQVLYFDAKGLELLVPGVLLAFAAGLLGFVLASLFRAIRLRDPATRRTAVVATIIGAVTASVGALVAAIARYVDISDFGDSSDRSAEAARDATQGAAYVIGFLFQNYLGAFALGLGFGMVAYHAMRVGLVSRFMGVLGMIAGVSIALPLFPVAIIQALWLVGLGLVLLGNSPGGLPPAWATGVATPWPNQLELRERREREAAGRPADPADEGVSRPRRGLLPKARTKKPEPEPAATPAATLHPSSKKRKRKRRD